MSGPVESGGSAFPMGSAHTIGGTPGETPGPSGFPGSLRDYFAGQALVGMLACTRLSTDVARDAYKYADAMIQERLK